jgi:hypothetical protein
MPVGFPERGNQRFELQANVGGGLFSGAKVLLMFFDSAFPQRDRFFPRRRLGFLRFRSVPFPLRRHIRHLAQRFFRASLLEAATLAI